MKFSHFELEQNILGHCNEEHDRVLLLDGGTVMSPLIGLYCGIHADDFTIKSTGRDLLIQFQSDKEVVARGFHAFYFFESQNGTVYRELNGNDLGTIIPLDTDTGEDETDNSYAMDEALLIASAKKHMQTGNIIFSSQIHNAMTYAVMHVCI